MINFNFERPLSTTAFDCGISTYKRSNFGIFGNADSITLSSNKSNAVTGAIILPFVPTITLLMKYYLDPRPSKLPHALYMTY